MYAIVVLFITISEQCIGQGWTPSEYQQQSVQMSKVDPEYKHSQNMAMLSTIEPENGHVGGFEAFRDSSRNYIVITDSNLFRFWDVTDVQNPIILGSIACDSNYTARDAEAVQYGDSTRLFLDWTYKKTFPADRIKHGMILDVPFYGII